MYLVSKWLKLFLVRCRLVDIHYQQLSELLYTFTPSKFYHCLLNVESSNLGISKAFNIEFVDITVKFTYQIGRTLNI